MTNEKILEQQVEALEKLLQLRTAIIEELQAKVDKLEGEKHLTQYPGWPHNNLPYVQAGNNLTFTGTCPDGTLHQWPTMWGGVTTPACTKCGAHVLSGATVTTGMAGTGFAVPNNISAVHIDNGSGNTTTTSNSGSNVFTLTGIVK